MNEITTFLPKKVIFLPPRSLTSPQYETSPCTGGSWNVPGHDRKCENCTKTCPAPGDRVVQACNEHRNTICLSDVVCTCPAGYFRQTNCITDMYAVDATCAKVTPSCANGFYKEAEATPTSDIDCRVCPSTCPSGYYQRSQIPATSKLYGCPFECAACSVCAKGTYENLNTQCNATHNTYCMNCTECPDDTYKVAACEGKMATKCWPCKEAPYGTYIPAQNRCNRTRDSITANCKYHVGDPNRTCNVTGQYIATQCNIRDALFSDEDRSSCKACDNRGCHPGYKRISCTGTLDRDDGTCVTCPNLPGARFDNKKTALLLARQFLTFLFFAKDSISQPTASFLSCRCRKGEYFSAECVCKRCEIQPSNCTVSVGGYSYYNGCEGDGTLDDSGCGQSRFFCGPACIPGEFQERECNSRINFERKCKKCREPVDGEYMQRGCLPTLDADIRQCSSPKTCTPSVCCVAFGLLFFWIYQCSQVAGCTSSSCFLQIQPTTFPVATGWMDAVPTAQQYRPSFPRNITWLGAATVDSVIVSGWIEPRCLPTVPRGCTGSWETCSQTTSA